MISVAAGTLRSWSDSDGEWCMLRDRAKTISGICNVLPAMTSTFTLRFLASSLFMASTAATIGAQATTPNCPDCATWNAPQAPFRMFGNTYFVGTHGLSAVLITSRDGHVLIDGGLPESAEPIAASVHALGFDIKDVKLLLNTHVHFDHAGGLSALQRLSGAAAAASPGSADVLRTGAVGRDDPQFGSLQAIAPLRGVRTFSFGDTLRVGALEMRPIRTPGHTPGGTSWSWTSCEAGRCWTFVYGDSQSAISADGFRFSSNATYPQVLDDFAAGFAALERAACDVLITPHPDASALWDRVARRDAGNRDALRDPDACRRYAARARAALAKRVATEAPPGR